MGNEIDTNPLDHRSLEPLNSMDRGRELLPMSRTDFGDLIRTKRKISL